MACIELMWRWSYCTETLMSLVSSHVVCQRLSAMQEQVRLPEFLVHFANNANSWLAKNTPRPPKMKSWPGLGTLSFELPRIPPPPPNENLVRTWHFEFWVAKNTPPHPIIHPQKWKFWSELGTLSFQFPRISYPLSVWRLTTVSPTDTVSLDTVAISLESRSLLV